MSADEAVASCSSSRKRKLDEVVSTDTNKPSESETTHLSPSKRHKQMGVGDACEGCGKENERFDSKYLETFAVRVCRECKFGRDDFQCLTKTAAKKDYLLTETELSSLAFIAKRLERSEARKFSTEMKLFLRRSVEALAKRKWLGALSAGKLAVDAVWRKDHADDSADAAQDDGDEWHVTEDGCRVHWLDAIDLERRRREKVRVDRLSQPKKATPKDRSLIAEMKPSQAALDLVNGALREGECAHAEFDSPVCDEDTGEWSKKCTKCGFIEAWDSLW